MRFRIVVFLLFFCCISRLTSQVTLLSEDFNGCALPAGWQVSSIGNQNSVWLVGYSTNNDALGQSIDSTCCLIIDDDATGDNTPSYVIDFKSPAFDASQHSTVELTMDVHYRDWNESEEYFDVLVTDGVTETRLAHFDKNRRNGALLSDHFTLKYDLSLITHSPQAQIILRYDDAGGFAWWAAVDNILVRGFGNGTNVVAETFNACQKPVDWETEIVAGDADWSFGLIDTASKAYSSGTSMDGSCFAFFDDDLVGQDAPYSTVRLATPWFDGSDFANYELNFDVILRYVKERIAVIVQHGNGDEFVVRESDGDVGGPYFPQYVHAVLDLSAYRNQQMRVVFEYVDGNDWGWWAGIDNVKITGTGAANDLCSNATEIFTGANCIAANNRTALFDGPPASCTEKSIAGLWYKWQATFNGLARVTTRADFNDVVSIFTGNCSAPAPLLCNNRDEHGFIGETTYFTAQAGVSYLIRVSGQEGGFGVPRGALCINVDQAPAAPVPPANDNCTTAAAITQNSNCLTISNLNAVTAQPLPSLNTLARADVWYSFTAPALPASELLEIRSNADFSDIITLYQGTCAALQEVAGNHKGGALEMPALNVGQTYFVQIAGTFATVEGNICPQLQTKQADAPVNDNCLSAVSVPIGGQCISGNNLHAAFSGKQPSCVVSADRDVWFKFVAPTSGSVRINSGATFEHVLSIWQGACNNLNEVFCAKNPLRCDGFIQVGNLSAGQTYYVQIASWNGAAGLNSGDICIKILNGLTPPDFQPLALEIEENCLGAGLAKLVVHANSGVAPYQFQGTPDGQTLASGDIYLVVVTDAMGCEQSVVGIVDECLVGSCNLVAALTAQLPTCAANSDGALTANVVGGVEPYTYAWSNDATTSSIQNLAGGTYTVTVTDAVDCETVISQQLVAPTPVAVVPTSIEQPAQGQSNGAIYVDVSGGNGVYTYVWLRNGTVFVNAEDLTAAPAGDYVLQVTDGNGCMTSVPFTLSEIVGTGDPQESVFAEVFPNPAKEKATLAVAFPTSRPLYLSIADATGKILRTQSFEQVLEQNIALEIKDLPAGAYQVRMLTGQDVLVQPLVVVR
ncbi:MAG: hypothetical protein IT262_00090 [Saprospiraceae bacterium]|nr:hypothetical protein [Saprospiraceae bacterium]